MVSSPEVFLSSPHLLDLMDFRVHEANRGGHLLEGVGEVLGPLVVVVWVVHFEIHLPSSLDEVEFFLKASQWFSLRSLTRGLPSFHLQWVCSSRVTSKLATSSFIGLAIIASWPNDQHYHLVLVGGASILNPVGGEAVNSNSLPTAASCGMLASMVASGTLSVRNCRGYISTS